MAEYRVLDIETVTDESVWTRNPATWQLAPRTQEIRLPSDVDEPAPAGVVPVSVFPPPQAQRVVAISWVNLSGDDNEWYFWRESVSVCHIDHQTPDVAERELLLKFREVQIADEATIVTWNGRCFDLPVLNLRMMKYGIPFPWYYQERDVRYRYTEVGHCDLMDVFSDYGASRNMKLGDACKLIGLPGKTGDVGGAGIQALVDGCKGSPSDSVRHVEAQIGAYCLSDSLQTALLFVRSRFHKGMIDMAHYNKAVRSFMVAGTDIDLSRLEIR